MLYRMVCQILWLALLSPPLVAAQEVTCWAPDGETKADNETYVPCNKLGIQSDGVYSSCCNLDGEPDERDRCLVTGLCVKGSTLFRGYCTDRSWDSPACVKVCMDEESGGSSNDTIELTSCSDNTYCCGRENLSCCGTDEAFELPTQSSVVSSNVTETAVVTEAAGSGPYKDATIGLAVVFGVVSLAAGLGILWLLRKNKALYAQLQDSQQSGPSQMQQTPHSQYADPYLQQHEDGAGTEITGASSPQPMAYAPYKAPTSPSVPEIDGTGSHHRYSELDATASSPPIGSQSGHGATSPGLDRSMNGTTMHSP